MAKILVIDDNRALRAMLRAHLEESGHDVAEGENGDEGVKLCTTQRFDVVITDILMPQREGMTTIRELRRKHPALKIIAISGGEAGATTPESYMNLATRFGADRTFTKPLEMRALLDAVDELLAG